MFVASLSMPVGWFLNTHYWRKLEAKCRSHKMCRICLSIDVNPFLWVLHSLWHKSSVLFCSPFPCCYVLRLPKGIACKGPRYCVYWWMVFATIVQHSDGLNYSTALPRDVVPSLSLQRQHIETWKGLQKGAPTDVTVEICESWRQVWSLVLCCWFWWFFLGGGEGGGVLSLSVMYSLPLMKKWKLTVTAI